MDSLLNGVRVGLGLDQHALVQGREFVLGGVKIPFELGPLGHSDADVLLHAVMDATLGALGEPDIGMLFPAHDPTLSGVCSITLLERVGQLAAQHRARILSLDAVVVLEKPAVAPYLESMRRNIAVALNLPLGRVGLKAKHPEGIGAIGRGEGVMAQAVVLLWCP